MTRAFSIDNAANDLSLLLALSARSKPVYVYGVSYGTQLVVRLIDNHQPDLNGVLLDSLTPLQDDARYDLSRRSTLVDAVGREILNRCDQDSLCHARMGAPTAQIYKMMLDKFASDPVLVEDVPGHDIKHFMGSLLDFPSLRAQIPYLALELSGGHKERLKDIVAQQQAITSGFGNYPQSALAIPLVGLISRSENDLRPDLTVAQLKTEEQALFFTSPIPGYLIDPGLPIYVPAIHSKTIVNRTYPIFVMQGTLDPKTAYQGATDHVIHLRKGGVVSLLSIEDAPHFTMMFAPECFALAAKALIGKKYFKDKRCGLKNSQELMPFQKAITN
jgi:pimeloyl-ACP methyl ester carboxylesterase